MNIANTTDHSPADGDIVVALEAHSGLGFTVRQVPNVAQLRAPTRAKALAVAVGFARDAGVNLWYSDGAMCVLLETHSDHQTANSSRGGVESMNILVVDDDATTLTYVSETLRTAGHRVIAMADARQAVKTIERGGIDLLMSDVSMPGMTGPELAADARRLRPELPVLLMSGSTQVDGYPFLAKPFKMQDLLNALHRALAFSASTAHPRPWQFDRLSSRTHQADGGARTDTGMPPRRTDGS